MRVKHYNNNVYRYDTKVCASILINPFSVTDPRTGRTRFRTRLSLRSGPLHPALAGEGRFYRSSVAGERRIAKVQLTTAHRYVFVFNRIFGVDYGDFDICNNKAGLPTSSQPSSFVTIGCYYIILSEVSASLQQ